MSGDEEWSIEFYNSSGNPTYKAVLEWQYKVKKELESIIADLKLDTSRVEVVEVTNIRHQFSDTECGPFCLYYIYSRLNGIPYSHFKHNPITDEKVTEFRKQIFNSKN